MLNAMQQCYIIWESVLSRAGRKGVIYATNQELSHQIFNEASIHSITQDCSSNKIKIIKHVLFKSPYLEKWHQIQRLMSSDQRSSSLPLEPPRHRSELAPTYPNTVVCSDFPVIVWLVISPKFRYRNFGGFGLFFGYHSVHIGIGFVDLYGFSCIIDEEETTEEPIPRLPKEPSLMKRPKNVVHALPSWNRLGIRSLIIT